MRTLLNLIAATLVTGWIVSISVFSIQNIQNVSVRFFWFESIKMPVGVLLAFCVGFGLILGAILPLAWQLLITTKAKKTSRSQKNVY